MSAPEAAQTLVAIVELSPPLAKAVAGLLLASGFVGAVADTRATLRHPARHARKRPDRDAP